MIRSIVFIISLIVLMMLLSLPLQTLELNLED